MQPAGLTLADWLGKDAGDDDVPALPGSAFAAGPRFRGSTPEARAASEDCVSVHWLQGSIPYGKAIDLAKYLQDATGSAPEFREWGRYRYDRTVEWPEHGISLFVDSSAERATSVHKDRACIQFTGSALDMLDGEGLRLLVAQLVGRFWFLATRVDVAYDDYARRVSMDQIRETCLAGGFTGFRFWDDHPKRERCEGGTRVVGYTHTFGSRGSENGTGKYLRVYDKGLESEGAQDCIRWEVEYSGDRARTIMGQLAYARDIGHLGAMLGALVGGAITFVERRAAAHGHVSRMCVVEWWAAMVERLGQVGVRLAKRVESLERSMRYIGTDLAAMIATIRQAKGAEFDGWLSAAIVRGTQRQGSRHRRLLRLWLGQNAAECDDWFTARPVGGVA